MKPNVQPILHFSYAPLHLESEIKLEKIIGFEKLYNRIDKILYSNMHKINKQIMHNCLAKIRKDRNPCVVDELPRIVYLIVCSEEIFVSDCNKAISDFAEKMLYCSNADDVDRCVYLQEYESYEEAYKVALDMKEPNPLCYAQ
jgi:hypothetical protein